MPYKNVKEVLVDATKFPAAIEARLPEGAPKVSTMLADAADRIPWRSLTCRRCRSCLRCQES
ncbi:hypothetical protein ES705_36401 [subsurface metagenome]